LMRDSAKRLRALALAVAVGAVILGSVGLGSQQAYAETPLRQESLDPESATRAFMRANALYAEARYDEAASLYEEILMAGFANADVQFNLGNAHYKSGRIGWAVLAYERALKLDPSHDDAAANLGFVRELLADRQSSVGGPFSEYLRRLSSSFTLGRLAVAVSVLYFVLVGAIIAGVARGGLVGWPGRLAAAIAIAMAVAGGLLGYRATQARANVEAIVLAPEIGVRTGPGEDFVLEFRLHEGTKVRLAEVRGEWARVSVSGTDLEGWLPAGRVERI
jgi:tetratricopeptide (TPR) repeat protein